MSDTAVVVGCLFNFRYPQEAIAVGVRSWVKAESDRVFDQEIQEMAQDSDAVTAISRGLAAEFDGAAPTPALLSDVYRELRDLADRMLARERANHTLQATALVHEAYLRLAGGSESKWNDRGHFFRLAARTMRHILIDYARSRGAAKRGGGAAGVLLTETALLFQDERPEILEIDDALEQLFALSPEKARVVELRYYGGCSVEETAEALNMSTATVNRYWRFARAWLKTQLTEHETTPEH